MYNQGPRQFVPFVVTIVGIVMTDLLIGITMGMVVAIFYILYNNYKKPFLFERSKDVGDDGTLRLGLAEDVTFINKASIQRTLSQIPNGTKVIIDASKTVNIDFDVMEIIQEFEVNAKYRDIDLTIIELENIKIRNQAKEVSKAINDDILPMTKS